MATQKFSTKTIGIIAVIVVAVLAILAFYFKLIPSFVSPGKEQVTYTGNKTVVQSSNVAMEMYPSNGQTIKGVMTIKLTNAPSNTAKVWFGMVPKSQYTDSTAPNLGFDPDGSNGWSIDFETKDIVNGDYIVFVVPEDSAGAQLGRLSVTVTVSN